MRRRIAVALIALTVACAGGGSVGPTTGSSRSEAASPTAEEVTTTVEVTTTGGSTEAGADRANPVRLGQQATVGDFLISVVSVEADATETVLAENQFNEPPPEGSQFMLVRIASTYQGEETGTPWIDLSWTGIGSSNVAVEASDCSTYPDSIFDVPEVFPGGAFEANICLTVPSAEVPGLLLILEQTLSFEETRRFFDLGL